MPKQNILNTLERKSILILGDFAILFFALKNYVYRAIDYDNRPENLTEQIAVFILGYLLYFMVGYVLDHYNIEKVIKSHTIDRIRIFLITVFYTLGVITLTTLLFDFSYWRFHLLIFITSFPIQILLWRILFNYIFRFVPTTKNVLYLYDESTAEHAQKNIELINSKEKNTYYKVIETHLNLENKTALKELDLTNEGLIRG